MKNDTFRQKTRSGNRCSNFRLADGCGSSEESAEIFMQPFQLRNVVQRAETHPLMAENHLSGCNCNAGCRARSATVDGASTRFRKWPLANNVNVPGAEMGRGDVREWRAKGFRSNGQFPASVEKSPSGIGAEISPAESRTCYPECPVQEAQVGPVGLRRSKVTYPSQPFPALDSIFMNWQFALWTCEG